jgi:hypothetical protein
MWLWTLRVLAGHAPTSGTLQAVGECIKAREAGSNSRPEDDMQPPTSLGAFACPAPILRVL